MSDKPYQLVVVMPVYNEAEAIAPVLRKWCAMLDTLALRYRIRAYNDGSKDATGQILQREAEASDGRVLAIDKPNSGHGPTILQGYREAAEEADWVFQIDSDDEMAPDSFPALWAKREAFDFLVGQRAGRRQPLARKIISCVSRLCVRLFYGKSVWDVNTPYRLMRAEVFAPLYAAIPENTFAPNVILSGLAAYNHLRSFEMPVPQHDRTTGEVSIKKWKLLKAATRSFVQTIAFATSFPPPKRLFVWALILAFATKLALMGLTTWPTYDTDSFRIVAARVLDGEAPWIGGRYNYGPLWAGVVALFQLIVGTGLGFEALVVLLLAGCESLIARILWQKQHQWGAILFLLSPLAIYCTGRFRMFDSIAILIALVAVVNFGEPQKVGDWRRVLGLSSLIGLSIMLKQLCFFFPFWLAFREKQWLKRLTVFCLPFAIFLMSFLPFVVHEGITRSRAEDFHEYIALVPQACTAAPNAPVRQQLAKAFPVTVSIYQHVFSYRPYDYPILWDDFVPRILQRFFSPFQLFVFSIIAFGWFLRKENLLSALGFYCAALVLFSCGHWTYYWSIPLLFTALYPSPWSLLFNLYGLFYCCQYSDTFNSKTSVLADLFLLLLILSMASALKLKARCLRHLAART